MDSKKIDELLTRYWECETSLEDEEQLRQYFQQGNVAEHHKEAAALFRYFHESKKKSIIDNSFDVTVTAQTSAKKRSKVVSIFNNSMRIAAGIAVLMVALWFVRSEVRKTTPQEMVDTYEDPKLAFEETKKALRIISQGIGQAEEHTRKINMFNEAREEISKPEKSNL